MILLFFFLSYLTFIAINWTDGFHTIYLKIEADLYKILPFSMPLNCFLGLGAGIFIFCLQKKYVNKETIFTLSFISSITMFFICNLAIFTGIVFGDFLIKYIFFISFIFIFIKLPVYYNLRKNKYITGDSFFIRLFLSVLLIYLFFNVNLYISYINSASYSFPYSAGVFDFLRMTNDSVIDEPLTLKTVGLCMCEQSDDTGTHRLTAYLLSSYPSVISGNLSRENLIVITNIQIWIAEFFLSLLLSIFFIILNCPEILERNYHNSGEPPGLLIVKKTSLKNIIILFMMFIAFTGTAYYSIWSNFKFNEAYEINMACRNGDLPEVRKLLFKNKEFINFKDRDGLTPLYYALFPSAGKSRESKKEVVEFLISQGADVNLKPGYLFSPLYIAVDTGRKDLVELLLEEGADVNVKWGGKTLLHRASGYSGKKEIVEILLNEGLDINAKDDEGRTPLHMAVISRNKEVVEFLLAGGAEVNIKDNNNKTPLDLTDNEETINLLKEHAVKKDFDL